MADLIEIGLTIGGWIIAGLVTIVGVRYAHRKEVESQRGREDSTTVYHPLRKEMESILANKYYLGFGGSPWSPSDEFEDIRRRGLLQPPRHDGLRREIESLLDLNKKQRDVHTKFYDARVEAIGDVLGSAIVEEVGGAKIPFLSAARIGPQDDQLLGALAGDEDKWLDRMRHIQQDASNAGSRAMWPSLNPNPAEMYATADELTRDSYNAYRDSFNAIMDQSTKIRDLLDREIKRVG